MRKRGVSFLVIWLVMMFLLGIGCKDYVFAGAYGIEKVKKESKQGFKELEAPSYSPHGSYETATEPEGKVLLKGCGYGETPRNAKISALKSLSEQIISQIKVQEKLSKRKEERKITTRYFSSSEIVSKSLLKGVKFVNYGKEPAGYKVCAYFTEKSFKDTVSYLMDCLKVDFKKLDRQQLKDVLKKANFLLNIAFLSPKGSKEISNFALKKIEEINTYLNYGCLIVNVIPETAKIIINQKEYSSGEPIYLPPETTYMVRIKAPGYEEVIKNVYLGKGEKRSLTVELVRKVKASFTVYVSANKPFLIDEAKDILTSAGFKISSLPLATNAFYIKLVDNKIKVGEYTKHILTIHVTAYRGEEEFRALSGRMKGFFTTPSTEEVLVKKKAGRLLRAVFKRLLNQLDVEKFRGEDEFDYSALLGEGQVRK